LETVWRTAKEHSKGESMKTGINTILMATDFLSSSRLALDYAVSMASKLSAKLVIVNAFELDPEANAVENVEHIPSRTRREAEARLATFVAGSSSVGVSAVSALEEGPVQTAILKAIEKYKAGLLVLGTQGIHRGLGHLLIGSNTEGLMLRATCPMLTVGPHVLAGVNLDSPFKKVIYISNLRPQAASAAPLALKMSQDLGIDIEIYQVVRKAAEGEKEIQVKERVAEYCSKLQALRPDIPEEWCSPEFQMGRIIPPQTVLDLSHDSSALMVVGVRGEMTLERHIHTSFPYRLLANAACPIITVRG
jgi:nucleotide-binding universal stress UspA family protein